SLDSCPFAATTLNYDEISHPIAARSISATSLHHKESSRPIMACPITITSLHHEECSHPFAATSRQHRGSRPTTAPPPSLHHREEGEEQSPFVDLLLHNRTDQAGGAQTLTFTELQLADFLRMFGASFRGETYFGGDPTLNRAASALPPGMAAHAFFIPGAPALGSANISGSTTTASALPESTTMASTLPLLGVPPSMEVVLSALCFAFPPWLICIIREGLLCYIPLDLLTNSACRKVAKAPPSRETSLIFMAGKMEVSSPDLDISKELSLSATD
ncbi:hypothetical protein C0991_004382, partial [Blastosporella zonata]